MRVVYKTAVENLTFGVHVGECFGLLGPNGAGKTTSVKFLLGEHPLTSGSYNFPYAGEQIQRGLCGTKFQDTLYHAARLGVCQQTDTLWPLLTAKEHMDFYLRMRLTSRYSSGDWVSYLNAVLKRVQLEDAEEKRVEAYSGGMKRKLSVCIAMYAGARTVFLDEPSTGMDPYARRALWKSISEALRRDRCVILTTHSMEEADAVCGRIGIMTEGTLRCVGSGQHLKDKYGSGYTIDVYTAEEDTKTVSLVGVTSPGVIVPIPIAAGKYGDLDREVCTMFSPNCVLQDVTGSHRRYVVPAITSMARAFKALGEFAAQHQLEHYAINQVTSLEDICITFAQQHAHVQ